MRFSSLLVATLVATLASASAGRAVAAEASVLTLEQKIPLGDVRGRIDHLAVDAARQVVYIAELGNDSVSAVDLKTGKVAGRITGLAEPQGIAFVPGSGLLFIANGRDGSVRFYRAADLTAVGRVEVGNDADNLRLDAAAGRVYVGYGNGLAVLDAATGAKLSSIPLAGRPEAFQLVPSGQSIFVNLPTKTSIGVVDRVAGKTTALWPMTDGANFPMALDAAGGRVMVVFRRGLPIPQSSGILGIFAMHDGSAVARAPTCGDSDDVFFDASRKRVYVTCGEGYIDVFDAQDSAFPRIAHVPTVIGARTGLFAPDLDRLFLAVRASGSEPASLRVYRPMP